MPSITVTSGAPNIADGVYPVILTKISGDPNNPENPKVVTAQRGPNAGQDIELWDWYFAVDNPGQPGDAVELNESTSTASGPRSKMYAYLTALRNGVPPAIGENIQFESLYGRAALATIRRDDTGWPRIVNLGAMPQGMQAQRLAQATGAPVQAPGAPAPAAAVAQPLRQAVGAGVGAQAPVVDELPF